MKKLLYIILGILILAIVAIGIVFMTINPNKFKPAIVAQVQKATGQELVINGDIEWTLFPTLGLKIGETALRNPQGFAQEDLVSFSSAQASLDILPLFSKHISIGDLKLKDAQIFVQTKSNGESNLTAIQEKRAPQKTNTPASSTQRASVSSSVKNDDNTLVSLNGWDLTLSGVEFINAKTLIRNDINQSTTELNEVNFSLDKLMLGQWTELDFSLVAKTADIVATVKGHAQLNIKRDFSQINIKSLHLTKDLTGQVLPNKKMHIDLTGAVDVDLVKKQAQFKDLVLQADDLKMSGTSIVTFASPLKVRFDFTTNNLDLDKFLNLNAESSSTTSLVEGKNNISALEKNKTHSSNTILSKKEPDLRALTSLDVEGVLNIPKAKIKNLMVSDVHTQLKIENGVLVLPHFKANLYDGKIEADMRLNVNPRLPQYDFQFNLTDVQIEELLQDYTQKDQVRVTGTTHAMINLNGEGLSPYRLHYNSLGNFDLSLKQGTLYGVNLPQIIYDAEKVIKGKKSLDVLKPQEGDKTTFGSLTTTLKLKDANLSTDDLLLTSHVLKVTGQGSTHIVSRALNFSTRLQVIGSLDGRHDDSMEKVKEYTIPVVFSGTLDDPIYRIQLKDLLQQISDKKLDKEVDRQLDKLNIDDEKKEKIKKGVTTLKNLFNF